MGGTILHFGQDSYHRIPVLKDAGYRITDCRSVIQLRTILQTGTFADAVVLTEGFYAISEGEPPVTRLESPIPLILFQEEDEPRSHSDFDLVIPEHTPPAQWLGDIGELIARSRAIQIRAGKLVAKSATLTRQAREIVERTRREIQRSRRERAREFPRIVGNWASADIREDSPVVPATCPDRSELDKLILFSLARLTQILHQMIRAGLDEETASACMQGLRVEHHLECATLESLLIQWKDHKRQHKC
jgi:hypothetical protein